MENLKVGSVVEGIVTGIENYGIFVRMPNDFCGLIHISEIADNFIKNVNDYAELGEKIYVEIINIDYSSKKCILSVKDLNYRMSRNKIIKESIRGFSPLKHHLPLWINEKITDIHNSSK